MPWRRPFKGGRGDHGAGFKSQGGENRGGGGFQIDFKGVLVHHLGVFHHAQVSGVRRVGLGVNGAVDVPGGGLGIERGAVMEKDAFFQLNGDGFLILAHLIAIGEPVGEGAVFADLEQRLIKEVEYELVGGHRVAEDRIQADRFQIHDALDFAAADRGGRKGGSAQGHCRQSHY
jgi:hypothetical protein